MARLPGDYSLETVNDDYLQSSRDVACKRALTAAKWIVDQVLRRTRHVYGYVDVPCSDRGLAGGKAGVIDSVAEAGRWISCDASRRSEDFRLWLCNVPLGVDRARADAAEPREASEIERPGRRARDSVRPDGQETHSSKSTANFA